MTGTAFAILAMLYPQILCRKKASRALTTTTSPPFLSFVVFSLYISNIKLKTTLSQGNLCIAPKSLWSTLQCKEARRNPDRNQEARRDTDRNQEARRNLDQKKQSRGPARGQIRSFANLRSSFFPSFSEMVFQMQQTLGKEKPKNFEPGKKMSGESLEGAIVRLKATE